MRVYFDHRQKQRLFGANHVEVVASIYFSETELAVIEEYGLDGLIVIYRKPEVWIDPFNGATRETDRSIYLGTFLKHAHVEPVASPAAAQAFEAKLMAALDGLKNYLTASTVPLQQKVYEL